MSCTTVWKCWHDTVIVIATRLDTLQQRAQEFREHA